MNTVLSAKPPSWFRITAVILLVWNGFGVFQYLMFSLASPQQLAMQVEDEAIYNFIATVPSWVTGAFAIAVFAGLVGSTALIARKMWARSMFILSLAGVLVQHFWTLALSDYLAVAGPMAAISPIIVITVAAFEIWMAHKGIKRGWLR
ncbi:hypothetical protein [Parasphingopyxis marina]|uniref:Sugar transporter n=1 Tax=Parasphingopyxis marina TaxID=2761622 RepID=A0A842I1S4_9SPHN|nr:hypothetical protein [Parasphingopyxis marina]MBC2778170.1 hypothetical protein [Parasphingopyxis marina]